MKGTYLIVLSLLAAGCTGAGGNPSLQTKGPAQTPPSPVANFTAVPSLTVPPPTATFAIAPLDDSQNSVYYFAPNMCDAKWTNNGQDLSCPGVLSENKPGYVGFITQAELSLPYEASALLTIPAQDPNFQGIFGAFPTRIIEAGDFFRAQLFCLPDHPCDVVFSLGYYASDGSFNEPFPSWSYNHTQNPQLINFPLGILAGQDVRLTLIVRAHGSPAEDYAVWVEPRIFRNPNIVTPTP